MQLEDKLVEDREAAHVESQHRDDVLEHGEDQLPEPLTEAVSNASVELRSKLLGAIRLVLDDAHVVVSDFRLPTREALALEALQSAVSASDPLGRFVYASDRRDMLEQALAVLQPNLTDADERSARELQVQFADLTERVGELRHALTDLEDSQDELVEQQQRAALAEDSAPEDTPSDPDAPRPATTLTGPDRPEPAPAPTTLIGPAIAETPPPPSSLIGAELAEPPPQPTTLIGPDPGPTLADVPSTLGDPEELAAQAQKPWWRRPFG